MNRLNLYPEERRSKLHAERWDTPPMTICPQVRSYYAEGYSPQQIATMTRRPVADVKLMCQRLPRPARSEYRGRA